MTGVQQPVPKRFLVMGVPVHLLDNYADWLMARSREGKGAHVITLNAEMTMQAEQSPALNRLIQHADLVVPDGAGVVLHLRLRGQRIRRCPGIELAESLLNQSHDIGPVFFYGGEPGVADAAASHWQQRLPHLKIAGTQHGYLTPEAEPGFCKHLHDLQPRLILIGLGVPRQEFWIAQHRHLCPNSLWIGVGGSFDIWAGKKDRAPRWLRNNHLEWVYRLYQEPWRWRRMLALPRFAWRSLTYAISKGI